MTDSIIERLDGFVVALLDEAEADTSTSSENGPGPQHASLMDRVQVLKAAVQYLSVRNKLADEGGDGKDEAEPAIVQFERRLKPRGARRG